MRTTAIKSCTICAAKKVFWKFFVHFQQIEVSKMKKLKVFFYRREDISTALRAINNFILANSFVSLRFVLCFGLRLPNDATGNSGRHRLM